MNELVKTDAFELNAEIVAGKLTSNAKELAERVREELKNYTVDKYIDNPESAKSDKAFLTKVKETISAKRKEVTTKWNEPLNIFMDEMKGLEKAVTEAYDGLNGIVKEAENKEKDLKKQQIENYWKTLDVKIVSLDRIFNPKWLNKTFKMDNIMLEVEEKIEKIQTEFQTVASMVSDDSEILKAFYLETLDLNATLQKGNELKANKAKAKELESVEIIKKVMGGEIVNQIPSATAINDKINAQNPGALNIEEAPGKINKAGEVMMEFTLHLKGTRQALLGLRQYIDSHNITYEKV